MKRRTFTAGKRRIWRIPLILILLLAWMSPAAHAQEASANPDAAALATVHNMGPSDAKEVEAFWDAFFSKEIKELHIPGLVFILVKDGEIFFAKGYGVSDLERQTPVIPDKTIFRVGSISKLFTATGVMQLYEKGLINLDEDVNHYLKRFKIAATFPQAITAAHLLTHSSGIGELVYGQHTFQESKFQSLGKYLSRRMPLRVLPPGEVFMYSDHGMSLAGFLIEEISGVPFESYMKENVLKPLGMERSTFTQSLPAILKPDMATGYNYKSGQNVPYQLDYCFTSPAAALCSTATDMARFMIAQLQNGRAPGGVGILNAATAREMQQRHFAHHPKLRGRAYGFSESDLIVDGRRAIWHDGAMPGFNSRLILIPSRNVGVFVCWNSENMKPKYDFTELFFDHYYPQKKDSAAVQPLKDSQNSSNRFAGHYRQIEGFSNQLLKLKYLMDLVPVTASSDNTLNAFGGKFVEVEPLLFQEIEDKSYLNFKEDSQGRNRRMFIGIGAFEKVKWYETPMAQRLLMGLFLVIFLSACIVWPIGYFIRRKRRQPSPSPLMFRYGRALAGVVSGLNLLFLIGVGLVFISIVDDYWIIMRGAYPWSLLNVLLYIPFLTIPLTVVLIILAVLAWSKKCWSLLARWHFTLVAMAALLYVWFLAYWNLIGFKY